MYGLPQAASGGSGVLSREAVEGAVRSQVARPRMRFHPGEHGAETINGSWTRDGLAGQFVRITGSGARYLFRGDAITT